jgi:aminopeptidase
MDQRIRKMAEILIHHSARIAPGDRVLLEATTAAEPLIRALYEGVLEAGGHPYPLLSFPEQNRAHFIHSSDAQLDHENLIRKFAYEKFESRIRIHSLTNTTQLNDISPDRQMILRKAQSDILKTQMKRGAAGEFKWVTTLFPTAAYAAEAGMTLEDFEDFVFLACLANQDDPIGLWEQVKEDQQAALDLFQGHETVQLSGPNIDLELSIKGRIFNNCYGTHNMPDGEIYTGPVEKSVNGWVKYSYPAILDGVVVRGVELVFKNGKVIEASADEQEEFLMSMLETDPGARYLGEFAVGTNRNIQQFTGNILFDEKIGGTIHMALGAGYPETGSKNTSAIHWDMICDMRKNSEIKVDGQIVYRDGKFVFG